MADCTCDQNPCENPNHYVGSACTSTMPVVMQQKIDAGWEKSAKGRICPACWVRNRPDIKGAIDSAREIAEQFRREAGLADD